MTRNKDISRNKDMTSISIYVDNDFAKDIFMQVIKNSHSDDDVLLMTRLFFVSESMGENADKMVDFLADVGLLHYLDDWIYLPNAQAERVSSLIEQNSMEGEES